MKRMSKHKMRQRAGFSIMEILVVLIIISISSTVAVVSYASFRKDEAIRGAAEKIRSIIVQTRTRAIAGGHPAEVVFNFDVQQVWVNDLTPAGLHQARKVIPPELLHYDVIMEEVQVGSTTTTSGQVTARFNADGSSEFLTVNIRRADSDDSLDESYYSIQIYPTSSDPKVWPHERK